MELKKRLLELEVDEDYIDKNNEFLDFCYNKNKKGKNIYKNNFDNYIIKGKIQGRCRSNSFDSKKSYYQNKPFWINKQFDKQFESELDFKRITKNPTFYSEKMYHYENKNINKNYHKNYLINQNDSSSNSSEENSERNSFDNLKNDIDLDLNLDLDKDRESSFCNKSDDDIYFFES